MATSLLDIVRYYDFFATSECRDLLFHVQEHRLTIPRIDSFLSQNELAFVGFELGPLVRQNYRARFPSEAAMIDLKGWATFERENPATFSGMYQFWVHKAP